MDFENEIDALLAASRWGAADADEVMAVASRTDAEGWVREWTGAGGEAWAAAVQRPSAALYLRAANYYSVALADTDGAVSEEALAERQRTCWERAAALLGGERIGRGWFFPAAAERRPVVLVDPGGGPVARAWAGGGAAARLRGFHWMTVESDVRPDWEAGLTPVADALLARPDVDPARMAVVGLGHAGYGVARTLAFEHRFAAAVADPGVTDAAAPWRAALPDAAREAPDRAAFERELHLAGLFDPRAATALRHAARPFGAPAYELHRRIGRFRLGDELAGITTPLLVCEYAGERRWPGQARELAERVPGAELLVREPGDDGVADWLSLAFREGSVRVGP